MIIVDTSVLAFLFFKDKRLTPAVKRALRANPHLLVPPLWRSEFRSVLLKYLRGRKIDQATASDLFEQARRRFEPFEAEPQTARVLRLAKDFRLSSYDAEFAALGDEHRALLLTNDGRSLADKLPAERVLRLSSFTY